MPHGHDSALKQFRAARLDIGACLPCPTAHTYTWSTIFASQDHSLAESDLVQHILSSGGEFVDDTTGRPKNVKVHGSGGQRRAWLLKEATHVS
jgi:hypothetical protein